MNRNLQFEVRSFANPDMAWAAGYFDSGITQQLGCVFRRNCMSDGFPPVEVIAAFPGYTPLSATFDWVSDPGSFLATDERQGTSQTAFGCRIDAAKKIQRVSLKIRVKARIGTLKSTHETGNPMWYILFDAKSMKASGDVERAGCEHE